MSVGTGPALLEAAQLLRAQAVSAVASRKPTSETDELLQSLASIEQGLHSMWGVMMQNQTQVAKMSSRLEKIERLVGGVIGEEVTVVGPRQRDMKFFEPKKLEQDKETQITPGTRVMIIGLQTDTKYNGSCGRIAMPEAGVEVEPNRVMVVLEGHDLVCLRVLNSNLKVVDETSEPPYSSANDNSNNTSPATNSQTSNAVQQPQQQPQQPQQPQQHQQPQPQKQSTVITRGPIQEHEVDAAAQETVNTDFTAGGDDWERFLEIEGVQAFRRPVVGKSVYLYKSVSTLNFPPGPFIQMYCDIPYRRVWDETAIAIEPLLTHQGNDVVYWAIKIPWPMACRDYVFYRRYKTYPESRTCVIMCRGADLGEHKAEVPGFVRVEDYVSTTVIRALSESTVQVQCTYMDDPKGLIPKFIVNFASKKAFPGMMDSFKAAFPGYEQHCKKLQLEQKQPQAPSDSASSAATSSDSTLSAPTSTNTDNANNDITTNTAQQPQDTPQAEDPTTTATLQSEEITFEYPYPWETVVEAVLHIKRHVVPKGQRISEEEENTFRLFSELPWLYRAVFKDITEIEWLDRIRIDKASRKLELLGGNVTWSERVKVEEITSWVAIKNTNSTLFQCVVSFRNSFIPNAICSQLIGLLKRQNIARRKLELEYTERLHKTRPLPAPVADSTTLSPITPSESPAIEVPVLSQQTSDEEAVFLAWARARMLHNVTLTPPLPSSHLISVTWLADPAAITDVAIQWYRRTDQSQQQQQQRSRQKIANATSASLSLSADDYGHVIEVELRPVIVEGGVGPVSRCKLSAPWTDDRIEASLKSFVDKNEAVFKVWVGTANSQECRLSVSGDGFVVKQGLLKKIASGSYTGFSVSVGVAGASDISSKMLQQQQVSSSESELGVVVVSGGKELKLVATDLVDRNLIVLTLRVFSDRATKV